MHHTHPDNRDGLARQRLGPRRWGEGNRLVSEQCGRDFLRYDDAPPRSTMQGNLEARCLYAGTRCEVVCDIPSVST